MSYADRGAVERGYKFRGVAWYPGASLYSTTNLILLGLVVIAGWYIYKHRR